MYIQNEQKSVAVLGSTGSVGTQALDVIRSLDMKVKLLSAGVNVKLAESQAREFHPSSIVMESERAAAELKMMLADTDVKVYAGTPGICEAVTECGAEIAVVAIAGFAGLQPSIAAAKAKMRLAMANKEAIIVAGKLLSDAISAAKTELIPVDSEHCAVFQCLESNRVSPYTNKDCHAISGLAGEYCDNINRIILTASGGAFRGKKRADLENVTATQALAHPTWKMGSKITIDSATLMNKGFEVIEAVRLFGVAPEKVEVIVHPQSIIHSMVEYIDFDILAQLSVPDMRSCIQYALTYPNKVETKIIDRLDFAKMNTLTFEQPDTETFRALHLAYETIKRDGIVPAVLVASDEEAVEAFIKGKMGFNRIVEVVEKVLLQAPNIQSPSLTDIMDSDKWARETAKEIIQNHIQ